MTVSHFRISSNFSGKARANYGTPLVGLAPSLAHKYYAGQTMTVIYPEIKTLKNIDLKHFILFITYEWARNIVF